VTDRTVMTRVKGDVSDFERAMMKARASVRGVREEINTTNDRTAWLAQGFMALAPAIAPLGAAAVPMLAGLSTGLFMAGTAAGVLLLSFNGMGDALDAVNEYSIAPTTDNLVKMQQALEDMGPAGAHFVMFLDSLRPVIDDLQNAGREGMFPGFEEGIESLLDRGPQVEEIIRNIAEGIGELAADGGADLASDRWTKFFDYMENDAKPIILDMGRTLGNLVLGISNVMVALDPATQDFSAGLLKFSQDFAKATANLESNQGFQEFLDYVHQMGPEVLDLFIAISNAIIQLVEAAAPIGHVLIPGLAALANVLAAIADTPLGTVFVALGAAVGIYGRAVALAEITTGKMGKTLFAEANSARKARLAWRDLGNTILYSGRSSTQIQKEMAYATETGNKTLLAQQTRALEARKSVTAYARQIGPAVAQAGLLAASLTGVAESAGLSNAATGALIGSFAGPGGAAVGGFAGLLLDMSSAADKGTDAVGRLDGVVDSSTATIKQMRDALATARTELAAMQDDTRSDDLFEYLQNSLDPDVWVEFTNLAFGAKTAEDQLAESIRKSQQEIDAAEGGPKSLGAALEGSLGPALGYTADEFDRASQSAAEFEKSLAGVNALLEKRGSLRDYAESLREFSTTLKKNGEGLNVFTEKGSENQKALDNIAGTALKYARTLRGLDRIDFLANARKQFVDAAEAAGRTRKQAEGLADDLGLIGRHPIKPKVDDSDVKKGKRSADELGNSLDKTVKLRRTKVDSSSVKKATGDVEWLDTYLDITASKPRVVHVDADTSSARSKLDSLRAAISSRMVVPVSIAAPGKMVGGYTGDGPKHEVAGLVHRGEVVIPQELVQRDRSMLWSRYGHLPGMADGGLAGSASAAGFGSGVNFGGAGLQALIIGLRDAIRAGEKAIRQETHARDKLAKKLDHERDILDKLLDAQNALSAGIQAGLSANNPLDAIPASQNPWDAGSTSQERLPSFDEIIKKIVTATFTATAFQDAEGYIGKYLTGGAFESVVASGNSDLVNAFAKFTPAQLAEYQAKYDAMTGAQKNAGSEAGAIRYDAEIADQAEIVGRLRERVTRMNQRLRDMERLVKRYEKMLEDARDTKKERQEKAEKAKKAREEKAHEDSKPSKGSRASEQREGLSSSAAGQRVAVDLGDRDPAAHMTGLRRDVQALARAISGSQDRAADKIVAGVGDAFTKGTRAGVRRAK